MLAKRVVRPDPTTVLTDDGYLYEWANGGEAVDVLEHHRRALLSVKGAQLVEVEVVDQPVIIPLLTVREAVELTLIPAAQREPDPDLSSVVVEAPDLEPVTVDLATVEPAAREPDPDLSHVVVDAPEPQPLTVETATVPAPDRTPDPAVEPNVSHYWSDADKELLDAQRGG